MPPPFSFGAKENMGEKPGYVTYSRNNVVGGFGAQKGKKRCPPSLVDFMASEQAGLAARQGLHVSTHLQS